MLWPIAWQSVSCQGRCRLLPCQIFLPYTSSSLTSLAIRFRNSLPKSQGELEAATRANLHRESTWLVSKCFIAFHIGVLNRQHSSDCRPSM